MINFVRIKGLTSKLFLKNSNKGKNLNNGITNDENDDFITDTFNENEYKQILRNTEKKIAREIANNPDNIERYNKRGNQALTAIYGIPTALYLGTTVATAIAVPPVVMGLIGFGIAGGAVATTNYLTGSQSVLGSLYKKLKIKFGRSNSKIDLNKYKNNFNNEKFKQNEILKNAIANFNNKKFTEQNLAIDLQEHTENLINYGKSDLKFDDDEISQNILNEITQNVLDSNKKLLQIHSNTTNIVSLQKELQEFINICQDYDKNLDNNALKYTTNLTSHITNVFDSYKNQLTIKNKLSEIHKKYENELNSVKTLYDKAKAPIINSINSLNEQFEALESGSETQAIILESINNFSEKYSELTMEYEDKVSNIKNKEEQELRNCLTKEELEIVGKTNLTPQIVCDTINTFIDDNNYSKQNKELTLNSEIFDNKLYLSEDKVKTIIERIKNNQPYSSLIADFGKQIHDNINETNIKIRKNLTLNCDLVKTRIEDLNKEKNRYQESFTKQNDLYFETISKLQAKLAERRHILTERAKDIVFEQKQVTKEKFNQFVAKEKAKFNAELISQSTN